MDPNSRYYGASANYNKPGGPVINRRLLTLIGIILVVIMLLFGAFSLFSSLSNGPRDQLATLVAREQSLQIFTSTNQAKITDNELTKINSEAGILLTSDTVTLTQQLKSKHKLTTIPKEIIALEADLTSEATLTQATLSGKFNETYKDLLEQKLASCLQLAESVQQGTTGQLNAALEQNIQNIKALQAQLQAGN